MQVELSLETTLNGRFQIDKVLGVGGFGITYLGHHVDLGYKCAIKEYFISGKCVRQPDGLTVGYQGIADEQFAKYKSRFLDEAKTLVKVKNRHVVSVIDVFEANNTAYIVMEFIEGITLQEKVRREGPLDYLLAVNYIAQLAEAVDCCHQRHILHRDIKPENVMITPDDRAVLIDFGSARDFVNNEVQRHTAILTQGYAPIEQYTATSKKGNYTDIYSLGGVFYYVVTGQKPMDATDRMLSEMPSPKSIATDLPEEAEKTILKAMQMKPEDRYQSIGEFMDDLVGKQVTSEVGDAVPPITPANPVVDVTKTTPSPRSKKPLYITLAIIGVLLVIIGSAIWNKKGDDVEKIQNLAVEYHRNCFVCNWKIENANDYSYVDYFFEAIVKLRDVEQQEADPLFRDTIEIGSDTLFTKLSNRLYEVSASLQKKMDGEYDKTEENIRWAKFTENKRKLDFWVKQLPDVTKASDFKFPPKPVKKDDYK